MSRILITDGTVISKDALLQKPAVLIEGTKITSVGKPPRDNGDLLKIDAKGCLVSPGFIDTHIHGNPKKIFLNEVKSGTTSIVIALSCDRLDRIYKAIDETKSFIRKEALGDNILGVRLEGPFINKEKAGAQNKAHIKRPDKKALLQIIKQCGPLLRMMTLAPELPGAGALIKTLAKNAVIASIGHSAAAYEEALKGIDDGISHATHIFNAMSGIDRRGPGASLAAALDDRVYAEIILDLIHVHPALFDLLMRLKDPSKTLLVTDSVRAEGYPQCRAPLRVPYYTYARVTGDVYRLKDGTIAGSSLTMMEAVKNAVETGRISLVNAVRMASTNAAELLGRQKTKGSIAAGMDADMVIFDRRFDVKTTIISGRIAYRKKGF